MAKLVKCKTCGGDISKEAKICPHCGEVPPKSTSMVTWLALVLIIIIVILPTSKSTPTSTTHTSVTTQKASIVHTTQPASLHTKAAQKKAKLSKVKETLTQTLKDLKEFKTYRYKNISMVLLNTRLQYIRSLGKKVFFSEDTAKTDPATYKLWQKAKKLQIQTQVKHYPLMRDALGPLLRQKMWEHNMHIVTTGKGYTRIILTAAGFANNGFIKKIHETMGVRYSDYRFKRADYKWFKGAREWTYFDLKTKKDNEL